MSDINIEIEEKVLPVVEIVVDENSAQSAKDSAEEAANIIDEFRDEIGDLLYPDDILVKGTIVKVGNNISIAALEFTCRIDKIPYTNTDIFAATIASTSTESHQRMDILVMTKFSTIEKIQGLEDLESIQEPETPEGTIKIGFFIIKGANISEPEVPDYSNFVDRSSPQTIYGQKTFKDPLSVYETNVAGVSIYKDMFSVFRFIGAISKYINIKWNEITTTYVIKFPSKPEGSLQTFAMVSDVDLKPDTSNQIEVALPATVQNSWHGKTVKFTSSGLLTIPGSFTNSGMTFEGIAKVGVTLNWAITAPKTFDFGNPPPVNGTQFFTFMQNEGLNSIMIIGI